MSLLNIEHARKFVGHDESLIATVFDLFENTRLELLASYEHARSDMANASNPQVWEAHHRAVHSAKPVLLILTGTALSEPLQSLSTRPAHQALDLTLRAADNLDAALRQLGLDIEAHRAFNSTVP